MAAEDAGSTKKSPEVPEPTLRSSSTRFRNDSGWFSADAEDVEATTVGGTVGPFGTGDVAWVVVATD